MSDAFHAVIGERFDILDAVSGRWSPEYYEQALRPLWQAVFDGVIKHWRAHYPDGGDARDITAFEVARILQEAATRCGDDRRVFDAIGAAVDGRPVPDSDHGRTLESIRQHIGDAALIAIVASLRETTRGERPRPIVMPGSH
jgi:hypothetical protein